MDNDKVTLIPTSKIVICDDCLRVADESSVTALVNDMAANGLTQAIEVRDLKKGRYELIDGGHRLEAALRLEWLEVKAIVRDCTADEARMRMALANLTRASLTMLDRALHVWRVKTEWIRQHPERKNGGYRKAGEYQFAESATWTEAIPGKAGLSDRTLADCAKIGKKIDRKAADYLRGTKISDNQRELLALVDYSPELQRSIAKFIADGEAVSVAQAAARVLGDVAEKTLIIEPEKQVKKVYSAFEKMTDDAKRAFVDLLKDEGFI